MDGGGQLMKFSVLISIYCKENPMFFKIALESVINQTCIPTEIVIVKDGALTYELDQIIENFEMRFPGLFKIIILPENRGLGLSLQAGIIECSYELIARMDTDDIAKPERFEKQLKKFSDNKEIDLVGTYIEEFEGAPDNILSSRVVPLTQNSIYKAAKRRNPFNHVTVMYKKTAVLEAGNYQPFLWCEDYYLWVRMIMKRCKMMNISESLVLARTGKEMFRRRGGLQYVRSEVNLQCKFLSIGFVNIFEFITNVILRSLIRLMPNNLRGVIYFKLLR
ncbi:Glycosyl transferase family 2 [Pelosinus propionicus DSM 13327]|uniref:Glycosyl transferase family 2 n=2 Tax=Pelosinus TaxID=365348 RepID=A0A1I4MP30_9FIRM|nr:Glycosyl transferase family 2 [Pelosinus propionicus DSM 13327]